MDREIIEKKISEKKQLRKEILAQTRELPEEYCLEADNKIREILTNMYEYKTADTVFCFVGTELEINTRPFLEKVLADGKRLAVPLCVGKGIMEAREIRSLSELKQGYYGLYEPDVSAPLVKPEEVGFAVIACLTCDHDGNRLGHGGGFYDRYFAAAPQIPAAIVCREKLTREEIPVESTDHAFPVVVTEAGLFFCGRV